MKRIAHRSQSSESFVVRRSALFVENDNRFLVFHSSSQKVTLGILHHEELRECQKLRAAAERPPSRAAAQPSPFTFILIRKRAVIGLPAVCSAAVYAAADLLNPNCSRASARGIRFLGLERASNNFINALF